jgi:hypothetical protein
MFTRPVVSARCFSFRCPAPLGALLLILVTAPLARAQALADRVPADAVIYIGWQGADALRQPYQQSHLKAVIDATDAHQLLEDFFPKLMEKVSEQDKHAGEAVNVLVSLAKPAWQYPTAVFFGGVDWEIANGQPIPKLALICRAGADSGKLDVQVQGLLNDAPEDVKGMVKTFHDNDLLGISVGYADPKAALSATLGKDRALAGSDAFQTALSKVGKDPACVAYVDFERLSDLVTTCIDKQGDGEAKQMWPRVRQASGLAGLKRFIWTSGFDGKDWSDQIFIAAPGQRTGLLTLLDPAPISDAAFAAIPSTATVAGVAKFDAAKFVDTIRGIATDIDPNAGAQIDEGLKQLDEALKMDVRRDFLQALGDEWAYYTDPGTGGRGSLGFVIVNRLRDPDRATRSLGMLETFANIQFAEQMKDQEVKVHVYQTKYNDLTIHYLGTPIVTPSWAIADGNLYIGLFPQVVASAAGHVGAKGKSILDNEQFTELRKRLAGESHGNINGFSYMDLPRTAPDAYAQWAMISRLSGFADLFGVQSPAMLLPPLGKLLPELSPAGSVSWTDNDGFHARGVSPFPGATALGTDPMGGQMLLPALMGAFAQERAKISNASPAIEEPQAVKAAAAQPQPSARPEPPAAVPAPPAAPAPPALTPPPAPRPPTPPPAPPEAR